MNSCPSCGYQCLNQYNYCPICASNLKKFEFTTTNGTGLQVSLNVDCPDYDSLGSQMRISCSKCGLNHPARFPEKKHGKT